MASLICNGMTVASSPSVCIRDATMQLAHGSMCMFIRVVVGFWPVLSPQFYILTVWLLLDGVAEENTCWKYLFA